MSSKSYHVTPRSDGRWAVKASNALRASSVHPTQQAATSAARSLAQQAGGAIIICAKSGQVFTAKSTVRVPTEAVRPHRQTAVTASAPDPFRVGFGERLRRARLMRGLSLRALADALNGAVSHTTLQKIECGETSPDSKLLGALAGTLAVRPDYFFKRDELKLVAKEYRKLTKLGAKQQQRLEEEAFEFFERYLEVERFFTLNSGDFPRHDLSRIAVDDLPEAIENAAEALRQEWGLGMNPIANVHATLEQHGVKVRLLKAAKGFDGFSAFADGGGRVVPVVGLSEQWLTTERDLPRFRFTALHELAHLTLDLPPGLSSKELEGCCHRFAGAMLIPREHFVRTFGENRVRIAVGELCAIKAEWGMSIAAIMKRASNLGLITAGRYKSYCIVANKQGWRTNEPGRWIGDESSQRFEQLVLRAMAEELITTSKAAGLLGVDLATLAERFEPLG